MSAILADIGPEAAFDDSLTRMLPRVYDELHNLAASYLRGERPGQTLQATSLVHEAYMRMKAGSGVAWNDRTHFVRLAAVVMRRILVDHARKRTAEKRGGGAFAIALTESALLLDDRQAEILEIDEAIQQLSALSSEKAQVVIMRYYGGCTIEETAHALDISTATVERHWRFARAWLKSQLFHDD